MCDLEQKIYIYISYTGAFGHGTGAKSNAEVEDRCDWCMS